MSSKHTRKTAHARNGSSREYAVNKNGQFNASAHKFLRSNSGHKPISSVPKQDRAFVDTNFTSGKSSAISKKK